MFVLKHLARGLAHGGHMSVIVYLGTEETRASTALCYPELGPQLLAESTRLRIPEQLVQEGLITTLMSPSIGVDNMFDF